MGEDKVTAVVELNDLKEHINVAVIKVSKIDENPSALRKVNKTSAGYEELVASVKKNGVVQSVLVKPIAGTDRYMLVDGLHRFNAAQDAGVEEIPARVAMLSDVDALNMQIMTNIQKVETKPVEYGKALQRIAALDPNMTLTKLADKIGKSPSTITNYLSLQKLEKTVADLVDGGSIEVCKAICLAKLPVEEQPSFVEAALNKTATEFAESVSARCKEIRDAAKAGKAAAPASFIPVAHLRKLSEVKDEAETHQARTALLKVVSISTPADAFDLAIKFILNLDPLSIEKAKAKFETEQLEKDARKKKLDDARAAKKAAELPQMLLDAQEAAKKAGKTLDLSGVAAAAGIDLKAEAVKAIAK